MDSIAARFNNKAGKLNFDDFLQIVCRLFALKGLFYNLFITKSRVIF